MSVYYFVIYFFIYGFLGWCTEVIFAAFKQGKFVNRGFLNGPICPIYGIGVTGVIFLLDPFRTRTVLLYITSVIIVTALEWITGFLLEKMFHNKWWDYSNLPLNLNGYVCVPFSLIWGVGCVLIVGYVQPLLHKGVSRLPVVVGSVFLVLLVGVLIADVIVTASGILKINRRLASMEKIAAELHELSERLGEGLYRGVAETLEKTDEAKQKFESVETSSSVRMKELREKYNELASKKTYISNRLINAFPKMESKKYKESWKELKERFRSK